MIKTLPLLFLLLGSLQGGTKLFLDFSISDPAALKQLDEALKVGLELKKAITALENKPEQAEDLKLLKEKLDIYENQMQKTYGLYPGLTYKMSPTSGYIFNLIPVEQKDKYIEQGFKIPLETPTIMIKDNSGSDVECYKIKIKYLQKQDSVLQFNSALSTATSIRNQIKNLEAQLAEKPELNKNKEIQEGMAGLKSTLENIESKLDEAYGVKKNGKYFFEPRSGAVYLALSEEDLSRLSDLRKARLKKD